MEEKEEEEQGGEAVILSGERKLNSRLSNEKKMKAETRKGEVE